MLNKIVVTFYVDKENPAGAHEGAAFARISLLAASAKAKPLVALMQEDEDIVFARVSHLAVCNRRLYFLTV